MSTPAAVFDQPVLAAQSAFRAIMDALARPGTLQPLAGVEPPFAPVSPEAAAVALTLFDHDTPVWLDEPLVAPEVASWLRFHTGAPLAGNPAEAAFALVSDPMRLPPLDAFNLGTAEYPDRSTTIILQLESLAHGSPLTLSGPGIRGSRHFAVAPLPVDMPQRLAANRALFPRGVDLLLVGPGAVAALPRSVRLEGV